MRPASGKDACAAATPEQRIRAQLEARSIVLIGMPGSGKSALGRRLAPRLELPFVDVDEEIERAAGKSIKEIFADHGEAYFRDGERRVIARLLASGPQVLATGGGALLNEETRANIASSGIAVWVKAAVAILVRRVAKRSTRPLFEGRDPEVVVKGLMDVRYPVYAAAADLTVESRDVPHEVIVGEMVDALARCPRLAGPACGGETATP
ncbi:MAG: shikimate kinase [Hyphomicrobiaceae bacterium]|nr:shikimate kinase [Hyphomicrobiaceae bacterium]